MKQTYSRYSLLVALAVMCLGLIGLVPRPATAQTGTVKVVVLDVPGGGSEMLANGIKALDNVKIERQDWFLKQIQGRGFQAKGIMKRPDDIKWLMKGAEIDYILYLTAKSDTAYEGRVVGPETGSHVHTFPIDRTPNGLSAAGARMVQREFEDFLAKKAQESMQAQQQQQQTAQVAQLDEEPSDDPNAVKKQAAQSKAAAKEKFSKDWLLVGVKGNGLRRDLHVAGFNEAVLSYTSAFYPGFSLELEAFPLGKSNPDMASVGFYGEYTHGFDSAQVPDDQGGQSAAPITHIDVEGGVLYQLGDALALKDSNEAKLNLGIGVRYNSFAVAENPALPSVSHTSLVLSSRVTRPAFSDKFMIRAGAKIMPFGVYGTGATLFGETSHTYGFGGDIGGLFQATEDIAFAFGYKFGLQRTVFTGTGEADFVDANAFELVQGFTGGLFYQY
ncbi:hypothetical protein FIV42_22070 [Persicimonas caeni]|uniref:Outer membrane protein beta-barrel domain-containing protein n=1 Tax=Persicimonas caeni TaxID=2292766 RepID=A0A4Y6PYK1_PERCE|nr:hypothetical protein [Persicimonas caeni]QDG53333.1 hypothetical protein FIV42_22070 [Persicimonas caeni]QED34554.1 hypothetical protein FRD00_22065 [Persicimonas caeni]